MKKIILCIIVFVSVYRCYTQSPVILASAWYRADYMHPGDTLWRNQTGNTHHAFTQQGDWPDSALFNYNRCFSYDGSIPAFRIPVSASGSDYTVMIAYRTDDTVSERGLWAFAADSGRIGISTRHIFRQKTTIGYSDTNRTDAIVNTITPSWKAGEFTPGTLFIGGTDSLTYKGKLGEVVVFERRISGQDLLQWQSYLSVKHGITLYKLPYLDSRGDTIWHYDAHPSYHAAISGLGRDTLFGLHQKQSIMDNRLSIGVGDLAPENTLNPVSIPEGNFLLWGIDTNLFHIPQTTYLQSGEEIFTYGNCLLEATGNAVRTLPTSVRVDVSLWQDVNPLNCVLLIDRDHRGDFSGGSVEIYTPAHFDTTGIVTFSDIYWDSDHSGSDLFRIGFYPVDTMQITVKSHATGGNSGVADHSGSNRESAFSPSDSNSYRLYPNPTTGKYNLTVSLSEVSDVVIRVLSSEGKLLETREGKGEKEYRFTGSLPAKGHYLIEIESSSEHKMLQIIHQ